MDLPLQMKEVDSKLKVNNVDEKFVLAEKQVKVQKLCLPLLYCVVVTDGQVAAFLSLSLYIKRIINLTVCPFYRVYIYSTTCSRTVKG